MSELDNLQLKRDYYFKMIEDCSHSLKEIDALIAALKADKPREWPVYLSHTGDLYPEFLLCPAGRTDKITVIEKRQIKVTHSMGSMMHSAWANSCTDYSHPDGWVKALKAIGIDAEVA